MMRRNSILLSCRRPKQNPLYILLCIGAFVMGCLITMISVDPLSCDYKQCTETIRQTDTEDTETWLGAVKNRVKGVEKSVFLVIIILSAPGNFEQRNTMRQTWLSDEKSDTHHLFVLGTSSLTPELNSSIQAEQKTHGDLLLLPSFIDSYQALAKKLLASFVYVHYSIRFRFLLKSDDDTYVQLPQLHKELKNVPYKQRLHWGFFDGRATPKKSGPWRESDWFLCDRYLPYALGGGYILSSDVVTYLATNSKYFKLYKSEDVSLGVWLSPLDLHRIHDTRFDTEYKSRGCNNKYLVTHKQSTVHMQDKFTTLKRTGVLCQEEFQVRRSYNYNWSVPPSQCCIRNSTTLP